LLLAALERAGERDDTYVVFTSDNGYMLGEHRLTFTKVVPYAESIRVPS
jgi:arylsulfatase A-like enzyme